MTLPTDADICAVLDGPYQVSQATSELPEPVTVVTSEWDGRKCWSMQSRTSLERLGCSVPDDWGYAVVFVFEGSV